MNEQPEGNEYLEWKDGWSGSWRGSIKEISLAAANWNLFYLQPERHAAEQRNTQHSIKFTKMNNKCIRSLAAAIPSLQLSLIRLSFHFCFTPSQIALHFRLHNDTYIYNIPKWISVFVSW